LASGQKERQEFYTEDAEGAEDAESVDAEEKAKWKEERGKRKEETGRRRGAGAVGVGREKVEGATCG
jgi:hypothetical protein